MRLLLDPRLRRAMFLLWWLGWLIILYLCLEPQPEMPLDLTDKSWHFLGYLAMSAGIASFCHERRCVLGWTALAVLMGGLIEIAQYFVPGRSSEWGDLLADAGGAVTGAAVALLWLRLVVAPLRRQAAAKMAQPAGSR